MLTHGAIPAPAGNFLNMSLEQAQLEAGVGCCVFDANYDEFGFLLTGCWIKTLWLFAHAYDAELWSQRQALLALQREGNAFIVELVVATEVFTLPQLVQFNRCHLAFRALTLADVVLGDGLNVMTDALHR